MKGKKLLAHVTSPADSHSQIDWPGVVGEVHLEAEVTPNPLGGFGIQYNGGAPSMMNNLKVEWE